MRIKITKGKNSVELDDNVLSDDTCYLYKDRCDRLQELIRTMAEAIDERKQSTDEDSEMAES